MGRISGDQNVTTAKAALNPVRQPTGLITRSGDDAEPENQPLHWHGGNRLLAAHLSPGRADRIDRCALIQDPCPAVGPIDAATREQQVAAGDEMLGEAHVLSGVRAGVDDRIPAGGQRGASCRVGLPPVSDDAWYLGHRDGRPPAPVEQRHLVSTLQACLEQMATDEAGPADKQYAAAHQASRAV